MNRKLTRISYNSNSWRSPTGEAARLEKGTFNEEFGFGYEDWLMRSEWEIDGWRYAFLQGANKSRAKLVKEARPFDVVLFCIRPDKRRQYIAEITEMECLSTPQAGEALDLFKANGWFEQMKSEVNAVGGNAAALDGSAYATDILNVRFRQSNIRRYPSDTFAEEGSEIEGWHRYQLQDFPIEDAQGAVRARIAASGPLVTLPYVRDPIDPVWVTPEHKHMQNTLKEQLEREYPGNRVVCEEDFIDVKMESSNERWIYEIKTDLNPVSVLRQAIGQLLEYAHLNIPEDGRVLHLVAVGRRALRKEEKQYLAQLKNCIHLDFDYRCVEI